MVDKGSYDDYTRLRLKRAGLVEPDPDLFGGGAPAILGRVTSPASKIGVGKFLLVQPTSVLGDEAERGVGHFDPFGSASVPVYLVGPGVPSTGDLLVCRFVDHRWIAERTRLAGTGTGGTGRIPGCFCDPIPATLTMTSADPTCNFSMFQSCTIRYQPTPPWAAPLLLGPDIFLSTEGFPDPVDGGAVFYYLLSCQLNQFLLTRLYPTSPFGSPFRDAVLYSWLVGGYGNTCSPFRLDNGLAYPGSDPTCSVTIDGA